MNEWFQPRTGRGHVRIVFDGRVLLFGAHATFGDVAEACSRPAAPDHAAPLPETSSFPAAFKFPHACEFPDAFRFQDDPAAILDCAAAVARLS